MSSAYETVTSRDCYILVWHAVVVLIWAFFFFYLLLYMLPVLTFRSQHFEISYIYQKYKTYILYLIVFICW